MVWGKKGARGITWAPQRLTNQPCRHFKWELLCVTEPKQTSITTLEDGQASWGSQQVSYPNAVGLYPIEVCLVWAVTAACLTGEAPRRRRLLKSGWWLGSLPGDGSYYVLLSSMIMNTWAFYCSLMLLYLFISMQYFIQSQKKKNLLRFEFFKGILRN